MPQLPVKTSSKKDARKCFLGLAHHNMTIHDPIQTYANNHMIAELAEPKIVPMSPNPLLVCMVGSGNKTNQ